MQIHNKQLPWHLAQVRQFQMLPVVVASTFFQAFWETWFEVYRYPDTCVSEYPASSLNVNKEA